MKYLNEAEASVWVSERRKKGHNVILLNGSLIGGDACEKRSTCYLEGTSPVYMDMDTGETFDLILK